MGISILPFVGPVSFVCQILYPLTLTLKCLFNRDVTFPAIVQWTAYWALYSLWSWLESTVLFFVVEYFPLYLELKILFFLWLVSPEFKGAGWIWYNLCEAPFQIADNRITEFVDSKLQKVLNVVASQGASGFGIAPADLTEKASVANVTNNFKASRDVDDAATTAVAQ